MHLRAWKAAALACIVPAGFFMAALIVRDLGSLQNEPGRIAQQVVGWYAGTMWKLWVLLLGLPLAALAVGCSLLTQNWNCHSDAMQFARQSLGIGLITTAAAGILAIVVLHMLAN
jgi:ABC-type Fe3+ transport system permease subunit